MGSGRDRTRRGGGLTGWWWRGLITGWTLIKYLPRRFGSQHIWNSYLRALSKWTPLSRHFASRFHFRGHVYTGRSALGSGAFTLRPRAGQRSSNSRSPSSYTGGEVQNRRDKFRSIRRTVGQGSATARPNEPTSQANRRTASVNTGPRSEKKNTVVIAGLSRAGPFSSSPAL